MKYLDYICYVLGVAIFYQALVLLGSIHHRSPTLEVTSFEFWGLHVLGVFGVLYGVWMSYSSYKNIQEGD